MPENDIADGNIQNNSEVRPKRDIEEKSAEMYQLQMQSPKYPMLLGKLRQHLVRIIAFKWLVSCMIGYQIQGVIFMIKAELCSDELGPATELGNNNPVMNNIL